MTCGVFKQNWVAMVCISVCLTLAAQARAQAPRDGVEALRADLKADRKAVIAEEMKFTERESEAFWPLYRSYRAEVDTVTDRIVNLVFEYADYYPNVPEDKASDMLKKYAKAESDLLAVKQKYLKKFSKVMPGSKVFRFAQLDNRFDLGTRVALANSIPIMPVGQTGSTNGQP